MCYAQIPRAHMPSDSWVLVTGANRGLGYATAKKLVFDGESVIVGARTQAAGAPGIDAAARLLMRMCQRKQLTSIRGVHRLDLVCD